MLLMPSFLPSSSITLVLRRPLVWSNRFCPELHPRHLPVTNKKSWTYVLARTGASEGAVDGQNEAVGIEDGNSDELTWWVGIEDGNSEEFS